MPKWSASRYDRARTKISSSQRPYIRESIRLVIACIIWLFIFEINDFSNISYALWVGGCITWSSGLSLARCSRATENTGWEVGHHRWTSTRAIESEFLSGLSFLSKWFYNLIFCLLGWFSIRSGTGRQGTDTVFTRAWSVRETKARRARKRVAVESGKGRKWFKFCRVRLNSKFCFFLQSRSKAEDPEQMKLKQRAKELQRQEMEELRQKEANETALQAIGNPKKRIKTNLNSSFHSNSSFAVNSHNKSLSGLPSFMSTPSKQVLEFAAWQISFAK